MSRIGIIREAIVKHGGTAPGACNHDYYHDGPRSRTVRNDNIVRIKINNRSDGLTASQRADVAAELSEHPDVARAYISRKLRKMTYGGSGGEHLIVLFDGTVR